MSTKRTLPVLLILATVAAARADYTITYNINLVAPVRLYSGLVHEQGYGITTPYGFDAGPSILSFTDPFPKDSIPPTATFLSLVDDPTDPGNPHLAYFLNNTIAATAIGNSFENVFAGGYTEAQVITALQNLYSEDEATINLGLDVLFPFLSANDAKNPLVGSGGLYAGGTLVEFSNGAAIGTGGIQAVPEPASLAVLGLGGLALLRRRRA